jgi:predicted MFS family arabinose efflux permease
LLTLGALILVAGAVSDQFGRLAVLRMGIVVFAVASLLCALAFSGWVLVAARCLQGLGAAFLVPSSLAMINARFSGAEQSRAIGTWTAWTGTAFVVGPLLGGVLVDAVGWRWIFGVNIVPLAVTLYLTTKLSSEEFAGDRSARVDVVGAVLNAVGLTGAVYALIEGQRLGFSNPAVVTGLVVGVACLVAFPWWERRTAHPMMPLHIFAARNFAVGNLATVSLYAAVSLGTLIVALFLQESAGLSATQAGLATLPVPVLSFFLARRFGTLAGAHGPRLYMAVGPLIAAGGYLLMAMAREPFNFWTQMLPGLVVFGLGLSITVSPLTAAILAAVDPAQSGIGSAINNAVSRIAGLIAVAFTGVIIGGAMDFAGFRQGALVTAALFALAGVISAVGIRNAQCDFDRVSSDSAARCHDRATPPPAYAKR